MHKNALFLIFLVFTLFGTVWFTYQGVSKYFYYKTLSIATAPKQIDWSVIKKKEDFFLLAASYQYQVEGQIFRGKQVVPNAWFYNVLGAESKRKEILSEELLVHYSPSDPQMSALFLKFPVKEIVYSLISIGIALYFIGLGYYVGSFQKSE